MAGKKLFAPSLVLALSAGAAGAWEFAYGPPSILDEGARRVSPVLSCPPGGGYVAVGTTGVFSADPDVYLVRTDNSGARVWEFAYDVNAAGLVNQGVAVAETPGGFAILSNSFDSTGVWFPAITLVDCDGGHLLTQAYGHPGRHLMGRDLIRAANGDLAVAGLSAAIVGAAEDAFLMRTDPAGLLLWNKIYDAGGQEAFNALIEARPLPVQVVGDLVAVGRYQPPSGSRQGLVARVDPNGGATAPGPWCMVHHGLTVSNDVYNSVAQITGPPSEFLFAGTTTGPGWGDDIWVARGNPCAGFAASRIGDPPPAATSEQGFDIREVQVPGPGAPAGSMVIAGARMAGVSTHAALVFVSTGAVLVPLGGKLFGDFAAGSEVFRSLAENPAGAPQPPGFILAGLTRTDWAPAGDPQDLYLVHFDPDPGAPSCHDEWLPAHEPGSLPTAGLGLLPWFPVVEGPIPTWVTDLSEEHPICP